MTDPEDPSQEEDREDLRLAVVMTGGVSLAVWMGGVALEIDRLRRAQPGVYADLLDLTASKVRVDVVSGSSAGGLNGALLATSVAYKDADLSKVRGVWLDAGDISTLLRSPFELNASSLLDGEGFRKDVEKALRSVSGLRRGEDGAKARTGATDYPVHLVITASLLEGQERGTVDSFGSVVRDRQHHARLTFRRGGPGLSPEQERTLDPAERCFDDFTPDGLERLALAARSSASFPGAFEPSFCRVGPGPEAALDMAAHADFDSSRWTVDGGALMNKPLDPALDAIGEQSAAEQVRRVLLYVVPDAGEWADRLPDQLDTPPGLARVLLGSLSTLPRNESIAEELASMKARNRRASLRDLEPWRRLEVPGAANALFADYSRLRAELLADAVLDDLALEASVAAAGGQVADAELWRRPLLRQSLVKAVEASRPALSEPPSLPTSRERTLDWLAEPSAAHRAGSVVVDLLRRGMGLQRPGDKNAVDSRGRMIALRRELHRHLRALERLEKPLTPDDRSTLAEAVRAPAGELKAGAWAKQAVELLGDRLTDGRQAADDIARLLMRALPALRIAHDGRRSEQAGAAARLDQLLNQTVPSAWAASSGATSDAGDSEPEPDEGLAGLLALDVLQVTLDGPQPAQPIELMQLSADTINGFTPDDAASEKLAGLQLGHFGAFYKRSWRASDWLWGRLDAAQRLSEMLFEPYRLRQRFRDSKTAADAIQKIALGPENSPQRLVLVDERWPRRWNRAAVEAELSFLDEGGPEAASNSPEADEALPASLPVCAQFVARRLQLEILEDELPHLAQAIQVDRENGAATSAAASELADEITGNAVVAPARAVDLFLTQRVGQEHIADEVGTDPFVKVVSTTAAVAGSVLHEAGAAVKPLRPFLRMLRGLILGLYLLVLAALGGDFVRTLFVASLAAGGALVTVGAFSSGLTSAVFIVGVAMLAGGAVLALLRGTRLAILGGLLLVALAVAALPDVLAAFEPLREARSYRPVAVTVALVIFGWMLGHVGARRRSRVVRWAGADYLIERKRGVRLRVPIGVTHFRTRLPDGSTFRSADLDDAARRVLRDALGTSVAPELARRFAEEHLTPGAKQVSRADVLAWERLARSAGDAPATPSPADPPSTTPTKPSERG